MSGEQYWYQLKKQQHDETLDKAIKWLFIRADLKAVKCISFKLSFALFV